MYQCYAGFAFPSGNPLESIRCLENGQWSPLPNCQGTNFVFAPFLLFSAIQITFAAEMLNNLLIN